MTATDPADLADAWGRMLADLAGYATAPLEPARPGPVRFHSGDIRLLIEQPQISADDQTETDDE